MPLGRIPLINIREHREPKVIVVPVAFTVIQSENANADKVLLQWNDGQVLKIFTAQHGLPFVAGKVFRQCQVGQRFEKPLAVFVRGAVVADLQGSMVSR